MITLEESSFAKVHGVTLLSAKATQRHRPGSALVRSSSAASSLGRSRPSSAPLRSASRSASSSTLPPPKPTADLMERLTSIPIHKLAPTHRDFVRHSLNLEKQRHVRPTSVPGAANAEAMEHKNLRRVFMFLDVRKDGVITIDEIYGCTKLLGGSLTLKEVADLVWEIDDHLEGRLSWDSFLTAYYRCRQNRTKCEPRGFLYLVEFLLMDRDFSGSVNVDEAMALLYQRHGKSDLEELTRHFFGDESMLAVVTLDAFYDRFGRERPKVASRFERRSSYNRDAMAALGTADAIAARRRVERLRSKKAKKRPEGVVRARRTLKGELDSGDGADSAHRQLPSCGNLLWWQSPEKKGAGGGGAEGGWSSDKADNVFLTDVDAPAEPAAPAASPSPEEPRQVRASPSVSVHQPPRQRRSVTSDGAAADESRASRRVSSPACTASAASHSQHQKQHQRKSVLLQTSHSASSAKLYGVGKSINVTIVAGPAAAADGPPSTPPGAGAGRVPSSTRRASLLASHEQQNPQPSRRGSSRASMTRRRSSASAPSLSRSSETKANPRPVPPGRRISTNVGSCKSFTAGLLEYDNLAEWNND